MSDREAERIAFLTAAGLADARRDPLPGDASTRRYERLTTPGGRSLMFMDQAASAESPPADPSWTPEQRLASGWNATARLSAGRIEAFAAVADHLLGLGLSAPEIIAVDAPRGFAVLEDFGDALFARVIEAGADEEPLYLAAVEALARLHQATPPETLSGAAGDWPLQAYDQTALQGGADLFVEWYPRLEPSIVLDEAALAEWRAVWAPIVELGANGASVIAHRDYHAENLIWLPEREAAARVGLIDFQDAVRAHPSWDLHSLLLDVRRDVSPRTQVLCIQRYRELTGVGPEFLSAYAGLGALNLCRILGVFARLIVRDGKPRYRAFLPRTWNLLRPYIKSARHREVRDWFRRHVPKDIRA